MGQGFGGLRNLAGSVPPIVRRDIVRGHVTLMVALAAREFEGDPTLAILGAPSKRCVLLRQVAVYLCSTCLQLRASECALALKLTPGTATRGNQAIEQRRDDPAFNECIERLESVCIQINAGAQAVMPDSELKTAGPSPQPRVCMRKPVAGDSSRPAEGRP